MTCFAQPLSDSYHLWSFLLAALHRSWCIRCMHRHPVFNDEQNKTSHLTVHLKIDSYASCRYISGTSVIRLMSPKHRTAQQVCLQRCIPSFPVCLCDVSELCVFLCLSLHTFIRSRRTSHYTIANTITNNEFLLLLAGPNDTVLTAERRCVRNSHLSYFGNRN